MTYTNKLRGQGLVEISLLLALIALAALVSMGSMGERISGMFSNISSEIDDANPSSGNTIDLSTINLDDFLRTGSWSQDENGIKSNFGMFFIENDKEEYTITLNATLSEVWQSSTPGGGFAILIDTSLDGTSDSGYALQFDRGLGGIALRERINGNEQPRDINISNAENPLIPESKRDEWWHNPRELSVNVSNSSTPGKKNLSVSIDGTNILSGHEINANSASSHTGFRSWHSETTYHDVTIR